MGPEDFMRAAGALRAGAGRAGVPGFPGGLGPDLLPLALLAGCCERLFLTRPPRAPGAVICGASHAPMPGLRAHASGLGPSPQDAFARAMGEVAEARALHALPGDPRLQGVPRLGPDLRPAGRVPAAGLLRGPGGGAPGHGLGAGRDPAQAARAAWHEAVERHAMAHWLSGVPAMPWEVPPSVRSLEAALRRDVQTAPLRFLRLPGAVPGYAVVAALSWLSEGVVPGFGCAPDPVEAACKAACEAMQGEFALHIEGGAGGFTDLAARLAARRDLTDPRPGPLAAGPAACPDFADLSRAGDGVTVLRALPGFPPPPEVPAGFHVLIGP